MINTITQNIFFRVIYFQYSYLLKNYLCFPLPMNQYPYFIFEEIRICFLLKLLTMLLNILNFIWKIVKQLSNKLFQKLILKIFVEEGYIFLKNSLSVYGVGTLRQKLALKLFRCLNFV